MSFTTTFGWLNVTPSFGFISHLPITISCLYLSWHNHVLGIYQVGKTPSYFGLRELLFLLVLYAHIFLYKQALTSPYTKYWDENTSSDCESSSILGECWVLFISGFLSCFPSVTLILGGFIAKFNITNGAFQRRKRVYVPRRKLHTQRVVKNLILTFYSWQLDLLTQISVMKSSCRILKKEK